MRGRTLLRLISIQRVLVKYGLDDVISATHLLRPMRFLFYLAPRRRDKSAPLGERLRLALEELGPIFVKFGQAISTRRDLLPPDIADELAKLQDAVPPYPAGMIFKRGDDALRGGRSEPVDELLALALTFTQPVDALATCRRDEFPAIEGFDHDRHRRDDRADDFVFLVVIEVHL